MLKAPPCVVIWYHRPRGPVANHGAVPPAPWRWSTGKSTRSVNATAYFTGARNAKAVTNILYRLRQRILGLPEEEREKYAYLLVDTPNRDK